ncbi:MAG: DUF2341 domain-containing protein, partial [Patescibacteria group bacterium]|nr:DUF2341 domain-containing protein [Patescibacteria group bacterium]
MFKKIIFILKNSFKNAGEYYRRKMRDLFYLLKINKSRKKICSGWYVIKIKDEKSKCKINSVNKLFLNIRKNKLTKNYSEINLDWKEKYFDLQKQFRRSLMKLNINRTIAIVFCIALIVTNSAQYFPHFSKAATHDWTITSQSDWNAGTKTNVDIATTPGDVNLHSSVFSSDWSSLADASEIISSGGSLVSAGNYIYALRGNDTTDFSRYDSAGNSWSAMTSISGTVGTGGSLTYDGTYIYALRGGGTTDFYRYNISGNSWSAMTSISGTVGAGGSLTYDGTYIYALRGGGTTDFYRYNISGNSWSAMTDFSVPSNWASGLEAWQYRTQISLSPVTPSANYQIKVLLTTSNFDYSHSLAANGADLRFTDISGSDLSYYISTWNGSGTSTIYVKVATTSTSSIYMYYGNSAAVAVSSYDNTFTKTFGESGLIGLWHMDDASGTTIADSSGNSNTGTLGGGTADYRPTWVGADGGQWDGVNQQFATGDSLTFDGNNDYVDAGNGSSLNLTSNITIEAWVKKSEVDRTETILSKGPYSLKIAADNKPYLELISGSEAIANTGSNWTGSAIFDGKLYIISGGNVSYTTSGTSWTSIGGGGILSNALAVFNGTLYAASTNANHIYRWDGGTTWTDVGVAGSGTIYDITVFNGKLYIPIYGASHVYRYDGGTTWTDLGGPGGWENALTVFNNNLYLATGSHVYRYDGGTTWTSIGTSGWVASLAVYNNLLYAGVGAHVYRYESGTTWTDLGAVGALSSVDMLNVYGDKLYAGGYGGSGHIYRYDGGTTWTDIGQIGGRDSWGVIVYNGKFYVSSDTTNYSIGSGIAAYSSTAINTTDWAHIVGTYDGVTAKIYVNGILTGSTTGAISIGTTSSNILLGNSWGSSIGGYGSEENFYGKMDEVRLYNRALSLGEVTTQYERRSYAVLEPTVSFGMEVVGGVGAGGSMVKAGNYIYALRGNNTTDFYKYDISGNSWVAITSASTTIGAGGSIIYDGTYIYALRGGADVKFYQYDIAENSWASLPDLHGLSSWSPTLNSWQ